MTPGPFEYFGQNWVSSENQSFLDEGATGLQCDFRVLGSQITRLYDGTILGGGVSALKGVLWAVEKTETEKLHFSAHLRQLKGYSAFTDFIKNQSTGVS